MRNPTEIDEFVSVQLKAMRTLNDMTQADLADHVGVSFQQIQKYENGTNRISAGRLRKYSRFRSARSFPNKSTLSKIEKIRKIVVSEG